MNGIAGCCSIYTVHTDGQKFDWKSNTGYIYALILSSNVIVSIVTAPSYYHNAELLKLVKKKKKNLSNKGLVLKTKKYFMALRVHKRFVGKNNEL